MVTRADIPTRYLLELEAELISMLPGNVGHLRLPGGPVAPPPAVAINDDSDDSSPPTPVTKAGEGVASATAAGPGGYQRLPDAEDADVAGMDEGEAAALMV